MHMPKQLRMKLDAKAKKMIFVRYQGESSNYRLFDPVKKKLSQCLETFNESVIAAPIKEGEIGLLKFKLHEEEQSSGEEEKENANEDRRINSIESSLSRQLARAESDTESN